MSNETFPITPPPELVQQWHHVWKQLSRDKLIDYLSRDKLIDYPEYMATQAARWGYDQAIKELETFLKKVND
jgi:hypothetical protein